MVVVRETRSSPRDKTLSRPSYLSSWHEFCRFLPSCQSCSQPCAEVGTRKPESPSLVRWLQPSPCFQVDAKLPSGSHKTLEGRSSFPLPIGFCEALCYILGRPEVIFLRMHPGLSHFRAFVPAVSSESMPPPHTSFSQGGKCGSSKALPDILPKVPCNQCCYTFALSVLSSS